LVKSETSSALNYGRRVALNQKVISFIKWELF
jgi:hypothetical protein